MWTIWKPSAACLRARPSTVTLGMYFSTLRLSPNGSVACEIIDFSSDRLMSSSSRRLNCSGFEQTSRSRKEPLEIGLLGLPPDPLIKRENAMLALKGSSCSGSYIASHQMRCSLIEYGSSHRRSRSPLKFVTESLAKNSALRRILKYLSFISRLNNQSKSRWP